MERYSPLPEGNGFRRNQRNISLFNELGRYDAHFYSLARVVQLLSAAGRGLDSGKGSVSMRSCALLLVSVALALSPGVANAITIAGFGDSITCDLCNDGSYLRLLDNYLDPDPVIYDGGDSADTTAEVLGRLDLWLTGLGAADVVIILAGTPDAYQAVGGFKNMAYDEAETLDNIETMLDLVLGNSMSVLLAAPPPVQFPCSEPDILSCAIIDSRLDSLSLELAMLASSKLVPFVDLYDIFSTHPDFLLPVGSANSLFRNDGLHPKITTGDDLIAASFASALLSDIIPEPSTGLLLAAGLCALASRRERPLYT